VVQRGFDAVAARPRAGDQDPREDDRNLLLEALLSARDHFVVLYSGRDIQSDGPLAPAVPIGDLLDAVDATFAVPETLTAEPVVRPRDLLTVHHSVQPFSPSGFAPLAEQPWSPRPKRYDQRMLETAYRLLGPRQELPALLGVDSTLENRPFPDQMSLQELLRWVRQPVEQLFQSGLGLYLKEAQEVVEDREGLELDTLEQWGLGVKVCQNWRTVHWTAERLQEQLLGRAALPPGMPGKVLVLTALDELTRCKAAVGPLGPPIQHDIAWMVAGTPSPLLLTGAVQADGDQLVQLA
jgi:exodeoxyribonuclease V gamma subunit